MESIKELRKICQPPELGKEFLYTRVMRKVSIYVTKLFLIMGIAPNTATVIQLIFMASSFFPFLVSGSWWNIVVSAILLNVAYVFDHVDGELARYHGPTYYGRLLDIAGHDMYYFVHIFIGLGLFLRGGSLILLLLGISASVFMMMLRLHELRAEHMALRREKKSGRVAKFAYDITLANMFLPVLYVLGVLDLLQYFMYFYGVYIPLFWIFWMIRKRQGKKDRKVKEETSTWKNIRNNI